MMRPSVSMPETSGLMPTTGELMTEGCVLLTGPSVSMPETSGLMLITSAMITEGVCVDDGNESVDDGRERGVHRAERSARGPVDGACLAPRMPPVPNPKP